LGGVLGEAHAESVSRWAMPGFVTPPRLSETFEEWKKRKGKLDFSEFKTGD